MSARKLAIVGTLGALAVAAWLTLGGSSKAGVSADRRSKTAAAVGAPGSASAPTPLSESRLAALELRVRELESAVPAAMASRESADENGSLRAPGESAATSDPAEEAARIDGWIAGREAALRDEPIDTGWSRETEAQLTRAFTDAAFQGTSLERIRCGSTFCAVIVRHEDVAARTDFSRFAYDVPMGAQFLLRTAPDGRLETNAYFIRPDDDEPDHPVRRL